MGELLYKKVKVSESLSWGVCVHGSVCVCVFQLKELQVI